MSDRHQDSATTDDPVSGDTAPSDGGATRRLRDVENASVVSRRGVLWRAGVATAAGAVALTALDQRRAEAATGGNFILGQSNSANATTALVPTGGPNPLMSLDGTGLSGTASTLVVKGPGGGVGLFAQGVSIVGTTTATIGLAINGTGDGSANGIFGASGSGTGVQGSSTSGTGVYASSGSGNALQVVGKTLFSRSGSNAVGSGNIMKTVAVAGLTATSLVLVTAQKHAPGVWITSAVPQVGQFVVHLNKTAPDNIKFAWFVLSG